MEAPPKYICGGKFKVIGQFAVYKSVTQDPVACCKDIEDSYEAAGALGLSDPLIVLIHDETEEYAGG